MPAQRLRQKQAVRRDREAPEVPLHLGVPEGQLQAECNRFGMDSVRPSDLQGLTVLLRSRDHGCESTLETGEDQRACVANLQREGRVDDVGRRQAVVKPPTRVTQVRRDRVDEGGNVVVRARLDLGDALGRRRLRLGRHLGDDLGGHDADLGPAIEGG